MEMKHNDTQRDISKLGSVWEERGGNAGGLKRQDKGYENESRKG